MVATQRKESVLGTDKVRIHISLSPKVLKKLKSVSKSGEDSKSEIIEAALLQFFTSPGVFHNLFESDKSFRDMLPQTVFDLAKGMGFDDGEAAKFAIWQQELNEEEEIGEHLAEEDEKKKGMK